MVVGVLTTSYPRHADDYAGSFVGDRVRALLAQGHAVEVFAAGPDGATTHECAGRLTVTRIGASLFYGDGEGAPERLERGGATIWIAALRFWSALAAAVRARTNHLDVLEAHWLVPCAAVAMQVAPEKPLRAFAHSGDVALLERLPGGDALARWLARPRAGRELAFVSPRLRARFAARAGLDLPVGSVERLTPPTDLFPPITTTSRRAARAALDLRGPTVIAVGRLVPIKGFDRLIAACAAATTAGPPAAIIVGDGPERPALAAAARVAGVNLSLPGWVPRSALARWLHAADVYAQPSAALPSGRTEGTPMAALEALAVGLPVVATTDAGLGYLTPRPDALELVHAHDAPAFGRALARHMSRFRVDNVTTV